VLQKLATLLQKLFYLQQLLQKLLSTKVGKCNNRLITSKVARSFFLSATVSATLLQQFLQQFLQQNT